MRYLDSVFLALSIGTIVLSVLIFIIQWRLYNEQQKDIETTKKIAKETGQITIKLSTDSSIKNRGKNLLSLNDKLHDKVKCKIVLPVKYDKKPLPSIEQGDYYAIQILTLALGLENFDIEEVDKCNPIYSKKLDGNLIYLCSPQTNPALNKEIPYGVLNTIDEKMNFPADIKCCDDYENKQLWFDQIMLPCWFYSDYDAREKGQDEPIKKIHIFDLNEEVIDGIQKVGKGSSVESDAERLYVDARKSDGKITVDEEVRDIGVLARLSKDDNKVIVIAGIHQYGTWIVAEFLNKVIRGESDNKGFNDAFDGGSDFVAIIHGNFYGAKLEVRNAEIYLGYIWVKKDGYWRRQNQSKNDKDLLHKEAMDI